MTQKWLRVCTPELTSWSQIPVHHLLCDLWQVTKVLSITAFTFSSRKMEAHEDEMRELF